jgi:hypothetical protein
VIREEIEALSHSCPRSSDRACIASRPCSSDARLRHRPPAAGACVLAPPVLLGGGSDEPAADLNDPTQPARQAPGDIRPPTSAHELRQQVLVAHEGRGLGVPGQDYSAMSGGLRGVPGADQRSRGYHRSTLRRGARLRCSPLRPAPSEDPNADYTNSLTIRATGQRRPLRRAVLQTTRSTPGGHRVRHALWRSRAATAAQLEVTATRLSTTPTCRSA